MWRSRWRRVRPLTALTAIDRLPANTDRPQRNSTARRWQCVNRGIDRCRHLLPHAGYADEARRSQVANLLGHHGEGCREPERVARAVETHLAVQAFEDVCERQVAEHTVVRSEIDDRSQCVDGGDQIAVGRHDRLGRSCRATGVHEGRDVGRLYRVDSPFQVVRHLKERIASTLHRLRPGDDERCASWRNPALNEHHALQRRQAFTLLKDSAEKFLVLHHGDRRVRVSENEAGFLRAQCLIQRRGARASEHDGGAGDQEFGTVERPDRDVIFLAEPDGEEVRGQLARALRVCAPGDWGPSIAGAVEHRRPVGARSGLVEEQLDKRAFSYRSDPR